MNCHQIGEAVRLLQENEVIAMPTETVYGLAANIYSETAIRKVYEMKRRPLKNPLIVHIGSPDQLSEISVNVPDTARFLAAHFWPGPLTMVMKKQESVSPLITAGGDTVAVRIPKHPVALELLKAVEFPLAAPSANPFNYLSPTSAEDVLKAFGKNAPFILDGGRCQKGIESTIIGFTNDGDVVLHRHGAIAREEIEAVLGRELIIHNQDELTPVAPGMLSKHYSPRTPLLLCNNVLQEIDQVTADNIGVLSLRTNYKHEKIKKLIRLSPSGDLSEAAHNLFAGLYEMDEAGLDCILSEIFPSIGLGVSINDRLMRGASLRNKHN